MGTGQDVFERLEKKYVLDRFQREGVMEALACSHRVDAYGTATVTSLYLDTDRSDLIERSLEKPLYKEKLRLRIYGAAEGACLLRAFGDPGERWPLAPAERALPVFLEMKKKYSGVVYKRRIALPLEAARAFLEGAPWDEARRLACCAAFADPLGQSPGRSAQIAREIRALMDRRGPLAPAVAVACERTALEPQEDAAFQRSTLRVTFDERIRALDMRCRDSSWFSVLGSRAQLMEVKSCGPLDAALARVLAQEGLYPQSFSKYGRAHRLLQNRSQRGKGERCA